MTQHKSVEAGFTPGPWSWDAGVIPPDGPGRYADIYVLDEDREPIILAQFNDCIPEGRANAHLIAAAPALYSALAKAIPILESDLRSASEMNDADWEGQSREAIDMARAALSSARGNQS